MFWAACVATLAWSWFSPSTSGDPATCVCASARVKDAWCEACGAGYLAGIRIPSRRLFEVLDAHGHDYDPKLIACESCRKAIAKEDYCDECRRGYRGGLLYMSRISYEVARGNREDPSKIACERCRTNAATFGWCDKCKIGRIGTIVAADRPGYEAAAVDTERLIQAIGQLKPCESCAIAHFTKGYCPACRKRHREDDKGK